MPVTNDFRRVQVSVTRTQLASFLGDKAQELGLIDFDPDRAEVFDNGASGFEIVFEKDTV